jgi:hypothetical protein
MTTCVGTQSPKYLEMAQGHISLSNRKVMKLQSRSYGDVELKCHLNKR